MYFKCSICSIFCNGNIQYAQHLKSVKHKKTVNMIKNEINDYSNSKPLDHSNNSHLKSKPVFQKSVININPSSDSCLRCDICNILCNGNIQYAEHIKGMKHQKVVNLKSDIQNISTEQLNSPIGFRLKAESVNKVNLVNPFTDASKNIKLETSNVINNKDESDNQIVNSCISSTNITDTTENPDTCLVQNINQNFEQFINYNTQKQEKEQTLIQNNTSVETGQNSCSEIGMIMEKEKQVSLQNNTPEINFNRNEMDDFFNDNVTLGVNSYFIKLINYEEQVNILKTQMTKLKRIIKNQYPQYTKYFKKISKMYKNEICKIDECQDIPLDFQRQNVWKFKCIKIPVKSSNGYILPNNNFTNVHYVWKIRSVYAPAIDITTNALYPYFIINIVKILEEFFNYVNISCMKDYSTNEVEILIQSNSKSDAMVTVITYNIITDFSNELQDFIYKTYSLMMNLKSLYYVIVNGNGDINYYRRIILFGEENLNDTICGVNITLPIDSNNFNYNYFGIFIQIITKYLQPFKDTILFELNSRTGSPALLLFSKYKEIITFTDQHYFIEIEKIRLANDIKNVIIEFDEIRCKSLLNSKIYQLVPFNAIINVDQPCISFNLILDELLKLPMLKRLVIVTSSITESTNTLLKLLNPHYSLFFPTRCCIVDKLLGNNSCNIVILVERKSQKMLSGTNLAKSKSPKSKKQSEENSVTLESECDLLNLTTNEISHTDENKDEIELVDLSSEETSEVIDLTEDVSENEIRQSEMLLDYVFTELTNTLPEPDVNESLEVNSNTKYNVDKNTKDTQRAQIEEIQPEIEIQKSKKHTGNLMKNNREKTIIYIKTLQHKLNNIEKFVKDCSHEVDQNTMMNVKLMVSSMLKTGLKVQELFKELKEVKCNKKNEKYPAPYVSLINSRLYYNSENQQKKETSLNNTSSIVNNDSNLENVPMDIC